MANSMVPATSTGGQSISTDGQLRWRQPSFAKETTTSRSDPLYGYDPIVKWESVRPTERAILEARQWLVDMAPLLVGARPDAVKQWLLALGMQTAGKGVTQADVVLRTAAYVSTLCDEPAHCFTSGTLKAAARHFKWFPTVSEIVEFLERETRGRRGQTEVARDLAVAQAVEPLPDQPKRAGVYEPPDVKLRQRLSRDRVRRFGQIPEEVGEWRRQMAECAAALGEISPWGAP